MSVNYINLKLAADWLANCKIPKLNFSNHCWTTKKEPLGAPVTFCSGGLLCEFEVIPGLKFKNGDVPAFNKSEAYDAFTEAFGITQDESKKLFGRTSDSPLETATMIRDFMRAKRADDELVAKLEAKRLEEERLRELPKKRISVEMTVEQAALVFAMLGSTIPSCDMVSDLYYEIQKKFGGHNPGYNDVLDGCVKYKPANLRQLVSKFTG